jgi:hypothetical protein
LGNARHEVATPEYLTMIEPARRRKLDALRAYGALPARKLSAGGKRLMLEIIPEFVNTGYGGRGTE